MQEKNKNWFKNKIVREFKLSTIIVMIFWAIMALTMFLMVWFIPKEGKWYDALSVTGALLVCVSILAFVLRMGLFGGVQKGMINYQIARENKILEENKLPTKEKVDEFSLANRRKKRSLIPILTGIIVGTILVIVSIPFF